MKFIFIKDYISNTTINTYQSPKLKLVLLGANVWKLRTYLSLMFW